MLTQQSLKDGISKIIEDIKISTKAWHFSNARRFITGGHYKGHDFYKNSKIISSFEVTVIEFTACSRYLLMR